MNINIIKTILLFILATVTQTSNAASWGPFNLVESRPVDEIWLNPGFYSYHFDLEKDLNNNNLGLGVEYRYSTINSITAGRFHNSDRQVTSYAAWYWQPLESGPVRLGMLIGALNGYPRARNGDWFLMAIPVASYEYKNIGINLTVVPTIKDTVYGSLTLQFKLKLY
jgi:hypothetical protein